MKYPSFCVSLSEDEPLVTASTRGVQNGRISVNIHENDGNLQVIGTVEQLLAVAVAIRDAVHVVEMEQLGYDVAVAE